MTEKKPPAEQRVETDPIGATKTPTLPSIQATFREKGYLIARNLIPRNLVDQVVKMIDNEVMPFNGGLPRHPPNEEGEFANAVNQFSTEGVLLNSIMNPQTLQVPEIKGFTDALLQLIGAKEISQCLAALDGQAQHLLHQVILFFICPGASAHIDSFGLDTSPRGGALTIWIPLEKIRPDAGPVFIYPNDILPKLQLEFDDDSEIWGHENPNHQAGMAYRLALKKHIAEQGKQPFVIEAGPGDVVFWSSVTVHGSMPVIIPNTSRRALQVLTCPNGKEVGTYLGSASDWPERHMRILSERGINWRPRP